MKGKVRNPNTVRLVLMGSTWCTTTRPWSAPARAGLIFTSTNKVYSGLPSLAMERSDYRYLPVDPRLREFGFSEATTLDFRSPYGCSKGYVDQYVIDTPIPRASRRRASGSRASPNPSSVKAKEGPHMKAAVIVGPEQAEVIRTPAPDPDPGELVVQLEGCGVCASNLPLWKGREWFSYPAPPGAPGHEGWGRIHALGAGVRGFEVGDRVTFLSYHAYAEFDRAPASSALKLPATLDNLPFPGESVGCAMNVFRRAEVSAGQTVAVVGTGFLGLIFTALAARRGARVIALSRRTFALELAEAYGAAATVLMDDHQRVLDRVRELSGGVGCDRVLEATGHQWPLDLAGELVRERGKLVIAGFHQDGPRQVNLQLWNWKGIDVINAHEREPRLYLEGIQEGIQAVAAGQLSLAGLITHQFDLEQVALAYRTLEQRPDGFIKGVIRL